MLFEWRRITLWFAAPARDVRAQWSTHSSRSPPNLKMLHVCRIKGVLARFWTSRLLSSRVVEPFRNVAFLWTYTLEASTAQAPAPPAHGLRRRVRERPRPRLRPRDALLQGRRAPGPHALRDRAAAARHSRVLPGPRERATPRRRSRSKRRASNSRRSARTASSTSGASSRGAPATAATPRPRAPPPRT